MRSTGRTGWYLRVIEPGEVTVGSPMELIGRDPGRLSVADAHLAMADRQMDNRGRIEALASHGPLAEEWRQPLRERLALA